MVRFSKEAYARYVQFGTHEVGWRANFRDLNSSITRMATLADGGRVLFQASRTRKRSANNSHRIKQYLAKFGLSFDSLHQNASRQRALHDAADGSPESKPNIVDRCSLARLMAGVEDPARLDEHQFDLFFRRRLVLRALGHNEHLASADVERAIGDQESTAGTRSESAKTNRDTARTTHLTADPSDRTRIAQLELRDTLKPAL